MDIIDFPSQNFDSRNPSDTISYLIIHSTEMLTANDSLTRLCDEASEVSAHFLIDEKGIVFKLVDPKFRAWHAGVSSFSKTTDARKKSLNGCSIGIELQHFENQEYTQEQMNSLGVLCKDLMAQYPISHDHVLAHSDIAPNRKSDPGPNFSWKTLASFGVGLWSDASLKEISFDLPATHQKLEMFGYDFKTPLGQDIEMNHIFKAFQLHFRSQNISGVWDVECELILDDLLFKKQNLTKK